MTKQKKPLVGITMGEMNGIGPEIIIKSLADKRIFDFCNVLIYGDSKVFNYYLEKLNSIDMSFNKVKEASESKENKINILKTGSPNAELNVGQPHVESGKYAFKVLEAATSDILAGKIDIMVTAPLDKSTINGDEVRFTGHTGYLSARDEQEALMIMANDKIKVAMVTGHVPLKDVSSHIKTDLIVQRIEQLNRSLIEDFGIQRPKIAVLGLNPHAGENGVLGNEEEKEIEPAISQVKTTGVFAFGPFPADGFFGAMDYLKYDGVLAMYHDQALIPVKSMFFDETVNFTAGLSFVRTSPDHGTAYSLAGKGVASPTSLRNSIYMACEIFRRRKETHQENNSDSPEKEKIKAVKPVS